jgi:hypothetical protein
MIGAPDALNRLTATLSDSSNGGNVNLLFGFAGWAFYRHHNIVLVGHLTGTTKFTTTPAGRNAGELARQNRRSRLHRRRDG